MSQQPHIRIQRLVAWILPQLSKHSLLGRGSKYPVIRKVHPSKEINARCERFQDDFLRIQAKVQFCLQKFCNLRQESGKKCSVRIQYHEIICVPDVMTYFEFSFHELIKFVHVDVHKELTREIPERKTDTHIVSNVKTFNNLLQKPEGIIVRNGTTQNVHQHLMIDIGEEFADIALEHPRRLRVIARDFVSELLESIHGAVCALADTAGVRIVDEEAIEERIQLPVHRVMYEPIADGCLMNLARLRVIDSECLVGSVPIALCSKLSMEFNNVICEMKRECGDILSLPFSL